MRTHIVNLAALTVFLLALLPHDSTFGADGCTDAPCLNGGACTVIDTFGFSCSCAAGFLGPTCAYPAAGDELITAGIYSWSGSGFSIGFKNGAEKSGLGQNFIATNRGTLQKVSFNISAQPEAVDRPEDLIVEFWNVDGSGVPTGNPLASRTVDGASFVAYTRVFLSIDFSADHIELEPSAQYAFTVSVLNKATEGDALYYASPYYNPADEFPGAEFLSYSNSGGWIIYGANDWSVYQVTVVGPFFDNGFEVLSP